MTLKAIACFDGRSSAVQSGVYRVTHGQLAMPTSSLATTPPNPNYTSAQSTTLTPPASSTVHYTTDGSDPTCASPSTPNPVSIPDSLTIKAISCRLDYTQSSIASFLYTIQGTVATPTITAGGNFANDVSVSLSTTSPGASIRYELAVGSAPTVPNCATSTLYTSAILVGSTDTRIQAIGCKTGWTDSAATSIETYILNAANPTLTPASPTSVPVSQIVSASSTTTGATIRYTDDGSAPTCASGTTPPTITGDGSELPVTVKAIACKTGYNTSAIVSGSYTKTGVLDPPTYSPIAGAYGPTQSVTITKGANNPVGVSLYYTVDGSSPTCSGTLYSGAISVATSQTVKAIACKSSPQWTTSSESAASYTINGAVATPSYTQNPATVYNDVTSTTITSTTPGATIYYNISVGSVPTVPTCGTGSTSQPINITKHDTRITAIACKSGWTDSATNPVIYTLKADTPTPDTAAGTYGNATTIVFSSSTGATLHGVYGSSGSPPADPTCASPIVDTIIIPAGSGAQMVKAIACRTDFQDSNLFTGVYTVNSPVTAPTLTIPYLDNAVNVSNTGTVQCYTASGTDPECSATNGGVPSITGGFCASGSTQYAAPVPIAVTTDFRARSCQTGYNQSTVAQQTVTISGTVGAVNITPADATTVNNDPSVTITSASSTKIYYRTDGTNPDCTGVGANLYSGAFSFPPTSAGSGAVQAIGCAAGYVSSAPATATYTYQVATPTSTATAGTRNNDESATLASTTTGASIRYRLDATDPANCGAGAAYGSAISLPSAAASPTPGLRAIACKTNYTTSAILSQDFTFETALPVVRYAYNNAVIASDITTPSLSIKQDSVTTGSKICLQAVPGSPNPQCNGTTGNCDGGSTDLGANPAIYNFPATVATRIAARACKQYYNQHTTLAPRLLTPPATPVLRIFPTTATYMGGEIGGIAGADAICNSDPGRPDTSVPYLAYLGEPGTRDRFLDYPLFPMKDYYRADGVTLTFTTDLSTMTGLAAFPNAITPTPMNFWSGFGQTPLEVKSEHCLGWTSSSNLESGRNARSNYLNVGALAYNPVACNISNNLYCVEDFRPRIFVTTATYDGNLGGKVGADAKCQSDPGKPATGTYKAMLRFTNRDTTTDWVFQANKKYYRTDRTTLIGITDTNKKLPPTLTNPITASGVQVKTGFTDDFAPGTTNCVDYSSSVAIDYSTTGLANNTTVDSLLNGAADTTCDTTAPIICVEQ
jgi:hypothetical protein